MIVDNSTNIQAANPLNSAAVEIMDEGAYERQQQFNQQIANHDAQARQRARSILKKCREGFIPNLIQTPQMLPYDGILASKAILPLLELCLLEDKHCPPGASERQAFDRDPAYGIGRHSGKQLNFVGGEALMALVLKTWIPAFDQPNLSEIWTGIGTWSGQYKLESSQSIDQST